MSSKYHRDPSEHEEPPCPVVKAYRNDTFLNSSHARHIRILCEYEETMQRLRVAQVRATVMFFGSARSKDRAAFDKALVKAQAAVSDAADGSEEAAAATALLSRLKKVEWMCEYMEKIRELARRITQWSVARAAQQLELVSGVARGARLNKRSRGDARLDDDTVHGSSSSSTGAHGPPTAKRIPSGGGEYEYPAHSSDDVRPESHLSGTAAAGGSGGHHQAVYVCTGGGPGFMEAANKGAADVPGGKSIGMGITLPFEAGLNPYVTPELAFEYHYFFTRKFWMAYHMQALVVAPGGFGTCDELFELVTLKQTGKMQRSLPIVLFGKKYWKEVVNWKSFGDYGVINQSDVDELLFTDSVEEAFDFITRSLESGALMWQNAASEPVDASMTS